MSKKRNVVGHGIVEFPDSMSDAEIQQFIHEEEQRQRGSVGNVIAKPEGSDEGFMTRAWNWLTTPKATADDVLSAAQRIPEGLANMAKSGSPYGTPDDMTKERYPDVTMDNLKAWKDEIVNEASKVPPMPIYHHASGMKIADADASGMAGALTYPINVAESTTKKMASMGTAPLAPALLFAPKPVQAAVGGKMAIDSARDLGSVLRDHGSEVLTHPDVMERGLDDLAGWEGGLAATGEGAAGSLDAINSPRAMTMRKMQEGRVYSPEITRKILKDLNIPVWPGDLMAGGPMRIATEAVSQAPITRRFVRGARTKQAQAVMDADQALAPGDWRRDVIGEYVDNAVPPSVDKGHSFWGQTAVDLLSGHPLKAGGNLVSGAASVPVSRALAGGKISDWLTRSPERTYTDAVHEPLSPHQAAAAVAGTGLLGLGIAGMPPDVSGPIQASVPGLFARLRGRVGSKVNEAPTVPDPEGIHEQLELPHDQLTQALSKEAGYDVTKYGLHRPIDLFHRTPKSRTESIMQSGLDPAHSNDMMYGPGVHLGTENMANSYEEFAGRREPHDLLRVQLDTGMPVTQNMAWPNALHTPRAIGPKNIMVNPPDFAVQSREFGRNPAARKVQENYWDGDMDGMGNRFGAIQKLRFPNMESGSPVEQVLGSQILDPTNRGKGYGRMMYERSLEESLRRGTGSMISSPESLMNDRSKGTWLSLQRDFPVKVGYPEDFGIKLPGDGLTGRPEPIFHLDLRDFSRRLDPRDPQNSPGALAQSRMAQESGVEPTAERLGGLIKAKAPQDLGEITSWFPEYIDQQHAALVNEIKNEYVRNFQRGYKTNQDLDWSRRAANLKIERANQNGIFKKGMTKKEMQDAFADWLYNSGNY